MKTIKKLSIFALTAILSLGCAYSATTLNGSARASGTSVSYEDPNEDFTTYSNRAYNQYLLGDDAAIASQWEGYGIGDPFVMRYNGTYYLYVSSLDSESGVRGYKSADLVNWIPMTGEGLKEGFVSQDNVTTAAYAPEVYYFNGKFYMYTSPGGNGHYVLTADNPEGPFVKATNNFGLSIDGSVLIDDDEQMYFTYANSNGIKIAKMTDMLTVDTSSTPTLQNTSIGGWTEGSYVLKRNGVYYLTYTGNHVTSDGYRIAYSTADNITTSAGALSRTAFTRAINNPLVLETETELKGIGHSSTVMGPDMDSYYLVYHYLNSAGGPNRSLGIDRLTFNGKMMSVDAGLTGSIVPTLPAFYATGKDTERFETVGDILLSISSSKSDFTAEFNASGLSENVYYFGYTDSANYNMVQVNLLDKTVALVSVIDGARNTVASGTLVNDFSASALHSVRVAVRDGKVDVYFDNMLKIDDAALEVKAGKIGYKNSDDLTIGYTAISDVAMGMSDQAEPKQATSYVGANAYLYEDKYGASANLSENSGLVALSEGRMIGTNAMVLGTEGDTATYLVSFRNGGRYGLELVYRTEDGGKKIGVKVGNGNVVYRCTLPTVESDEDYVKAVIGEFEVLEGITTIRLECLGDEVGYACYRFIETSGVTPQYEQTLETYAEKGVDYKTIWKLKDGGHYAKAGTRQLAYFGDNTITDFTLEIELKLEGKTGTSNAGIVFHAQNYAASSYDSYTSMQGYYLSVNNNQIALERLNYADGTTNLATVVKDNPFSVSDTFIALKIQVRGNVITVWSGEQQLIKVVDDWGFANGKIGLYTNGAAVIYKNLKVSA